MMLAAPYLIVPHERPALVRAHDLKAFGASFAPFFLMLPDAGVTYTTWNPSDKDPDISLSNANLTATLAAGLGGVRATRFVSGSEKFYAEINIDSILDQDDPSWGLSNATAGLAGVQHTNDANSWFFTHLHTGTTINKNNGGSTTALTSAVTWTAGKKWMLAINRATGNAWGGYDGTWFDSGNPATGANPMFTAMTGAITISTFPGRSGSSHTLNAGQSAFAHAVPSGFTGWLS